MSLVNLKSIFQEELEQRTADYKSNRVDNVVNTKFDYNKNSSISQTYGFDASMQIRGGRDNPLLDSVLRGRVYEPLRFSQNFENNNLFVKPETGEIEEQIYKTQTFDPRSTTPKEGTLYFNTNKSFNPATNPTDFSTAIGNNELPFTPLTELGGQFKENLSWENLYNSNHSPKDNASYKGNPPVNYGPNVSRGNLNIRSTTDGRFGFGGSSRTSVISAVGKLIGQVPFLDGDVTQFLQDTGKEPYIVSNIGDGGRLINSNILGGGLPVERALTDTARIGKFLTSPAGLLFIGKQNLLGLQQIPFTTDLNRTQLDKAGMKDFGAKFNLVYKPFYNPLSSLISTLGRAGRGPAGLVDKTEPGLAGLLSSVPALSELGDIIGDVLDAPYPKFQNEIYPEKSQLVQILEAGRIIDGKAPKSVFDSDLLTTDNSPLQDSQYGDDPTGIFSNPPYPDFNPIDEEENQLAQRGKTEIKIIDNFNPTSTSPTVQSKFGPNSTGSIEYPDFDASDGDINTPAGNRGKSFIGESAFNFTPTERNKNVLNKLGPFEENETSFPPANSASAEINNTFNGVDTDGNSLGDKHTLMDLGIGSNIDGTIRYREKLEEAHPNDSENGTIEGSENGMPFYFKDMRDGAFIFFRAYLEGLTENISPSWTPTNFIGRSEPVYNYERAERELTMTLKLFAQSKKELNMIYKKMNKLTSMCYPEYFEDEYGNRMKPPLTKLRLGEMFGTANNELMGFLKSINYTVEQASPWEYEAGKRVPKFINATVSYQVIHSSIPNLKTKFYGYIGDW